MPLSSPPSRKKLYKIPSERKICGVCAGLADYFELETWVVRLIVVSMFLFSFGLFNGPVFIAYFVLCLVLDPKPGTEKQSKHDSTHSWRRADTQEAPENRPYRPSVSDVWRKSESPQQILENIDRKFARIETRLQLMERFVTSRQFDLDRKFRAVD